MKDILPVGIVTRTSDGNESWTLDMGDDGIHLVLSEAEVQASDIIGKGLADYALILDMLPPERRIPDDVAENARAIILEVRPSSEASLQRMAALRVAYPALPIVAAVRNAEIAAVRALLRNGITDVIALPLQVSELTAVMDDLRTTIRAHASATTKTGQIVSVIGSVGGAGATTLATQLASLQARLGQASKQQTCLFDLDLQFGDAGTFLGVGSPLTLADLLNAGSRVDSELLRNVTTDAPGGLHVVTAPNDIMPMEAVNPDQMFRIIELAQREFDTVYLDLPGNWTNWSLSLVARSQVILLVVELTIASLRQARRQIALLLSQDINPDRIQVVVNRVEKKMFRAIDLKDAEAALAHPVQFSIANDFPLVSSALDQGVLIEDLKPGSKVCKDLRTIVDYCMADALVESR